MDGPLKECVWPGIESAQPAVFFHQRGSVSVHERAGFLDVCLPKQLLQLAEWVLQLLFFFFSFLLSLLEMSRNKIPMLPVNLPPFPPPFICILEDFTAIVLLRCCALATNFETHTLHVFCF